VKLFPARRAGTVTGDHRVDQRVVVDISRGGDAAARGRDVVESVAAVTIEIGAAPAMFGQAEVEDARVFAGSL